MSSTGSLTSNLTADLSGDADGSGLEASGVVVESIFVDTLSNSLSGMLSTEN